MRILTVISTWLFVLCLPVLLLTAGIWWAANSHWLYTSGFARYNVTETTGLSQAELGRVATGLIDYFNSGEEYLNLVVTRDGQPFELFTREEVIHFRDVKRLFRLDFWVLVGTATYAAGYAAATLWRKGRYRRQLSRAVLGGSGLTLALMLLLGIGTVLGFDRLFLQFHLIAFTNEFWSTEGYMLLLFPSGFWYDTVIYCAAATASGAVILAAGAGGYLLLTRRAPKA